MWICLFLLSILSISTYVIWSFVVLCIYNCYIFLLYWEKTVISNVRHKNNEKKGTTHGRKIATFFIFCDRKSNNQQKLTKIYINALFSPGIHRLLQDYLACILLSRYWIQMKATKMKETLAGEKFLKEEKNERKVSHLT